MLTLVNSYSYMVRNIVFSYIYNEIASINRRSRSFLILKVVIENVKAGIRAMYL